MDFVNSILDCSGFSGLKLSKSLNDIQDGAFRGCTGFKGSLIIPDTCKYIFEYAFYGCSGFDGEFKLSKSIQIIKEGAFSGCSGLIGNLVIPDSLKEIESS